MAISIDDIKDRESLDTWLNERPEAVRQNCAVFIAARAALRVMSPAVDLLQFSLWPRKGNLTAVPIWRSLLTSSLTAKKPTLKVRHAVASASADSGAAAMGIALKHTPELVALASANTASQVAEFAIGEFDSAASASAFMRATRLYASVGWHEVIADCQVWMDHAASDGTCGIDVAPLNEGNFEITPDWSVVREKLLHDTDPKRGADWSFWVEWYDKILRGDPQDWGLLYEIAVSQDIDWAARPREVNEAIARSVEKHRQPQQTGTPEASTKQVARTKAALTQNKSALPPTLDAIEFLISNEIDRLQNKNYVDDIEMEECKRMISVFMQLQQATRSLAEKVPEDQANDQDAQDVISTLSVYKGLINDWPRENAPEVVDSVFRLGLVGASTGVFVMCGLPAPVGAAVASAAFGGKKFADFAKSIVKGE